MRVSELDELDDLAVPQCELIERLGLKSDAAGHVLHSTCGVDDCRLAIHGQALHRKLRPVPIDDQARHRGNTGASRPEMVSVSGLRVAEPAILNRTLGWKNASAA